MKLFLIAILILSIGACTSNDDDGLSAECTSRIRQAQLLKRYDELYRGRSAKAFQEAQTLSLTTEAYINNPTEMGLELTKTSFLTTYDAWLDLAPFSAGSFQFHDDFGPRLNTFPIEVRFVDSLIASGFNPSFFAGLHGIEYILFNGTTSEVHTRLKDDEKALNVLVSYTYSFFGGLNNLNFAWTRIDLTSESRLGNSDTSGLGNIILTLKTHMERTLQNRVGIPLGISNSSLSGPASAEAPYTKRSLEYLKLSIEASQSAFFATDSTGSQGLPSLADYIRGLPTDEAASLVDEIESRYSTILDKLENIDGPLQEAVLQDANDVQEAYDAILRQFTTLGETVPATVCVDLM